MKNRNPYRLCDFLERKYDSVSVDSFTKYKRITIKTKGQGIELRDEVDGVEIGTKNQFKAKYNQFLLSKIDAMNGAFGIVPQECDEGIITGNFWTYDLNEKIISREYLRLLCINQVFTKFSVAASEGTTNRKYLRENKFLNLSIYLPPLPEQQLIISKINGVNQLIEEIKKLRSEQTKDLNNLLFSKYTELIEVAKWIPMKDVAPIHRRQVEINLDETYFEIGVRSFGRGLFEKPTFKGIDLTWQQPYWMKEGDLLFSNIKAWEGAVGLIPKKYSGWVGSHRYITCLPNLDLINPEFLFYYFRTQEGVEKLSSASPGTVDRNRTLNTKLLHQIKIPVPDLSLQKEFVDLLHNVNAIKEQHSKTEKELSELMPALLDKAFKGEL
jgi:type I restriction enzyme, S subunit